ncbi:prolipoprotein diacylglyceryl transferase family protein [Oceanicoccus sp. KOV_DT_Chl]|uniref:prolipoprotein diacylglyceryl transferase family protein n=1 Tax=Oceanicoccus sp. KOV_DT_Chl TaxID=1904639 RepID=UPI001359C42A|nr:prolipoprotein diacylglyceryl transferase family protein [Oceanicoccus sp. KOV_DT_Chl]
MNPEGIFGLSNNLVVISTALVLHIVIFYQLLKADSVSVRPVLAFFLLMSIVNFMGAKVFSLYFRDWQLMTPLSREFISGWRHPGALITTVIFGPLLLKKCFPAIPILKGVDAFAFSFCFFIALTRFSCFLNGCCTGEICSEWYCLTYPRESAVWFHQVNHHTIFFSAPSSLAVFPAHLLLGALELAASGALLWLYFNKRFDGQVGIAFLVIQGVCKAIAEQYKSPYANELFIAAILTTTLGLALIAGTRRHWGLTSQSQDS